MPLINHGQTLLKGKWYAATEKPISGSQQEKGWKPYAKAIKFSQVVNITRIALIINDCTIGRQFVCLKLFSY